MRFSTPDYVKSPTVGIGVITAVPAGMIQHALPVHGPDRVITRSGSPNWYVYAVEGVLGAVITVGSMQQFTSRSKLNASYDV